MKRNLLFKALLALMTIVGLSSCEQEGDDVKVIPEIEVSTKNLSFSADGNTTNGNGNAKITISANCDWVAAIDTPEASDWGWEVAPKSGSKDGDITITVTATEEARTATITISAPESEEAETITVTQAAPDAYLKISTEELNFDYLGAASDEQNGTIEVSANCEWTASITSEETDDVIADWGWTIEPTEGEDNDDIVVTTTKSLTARNATITVTSTEGGITKTVAVKQAAMSEDDFMTLPKVYDLLKEKAGTAVLKNYQEQDITVKGIISFDPSVKCLNKGQFTIMTEGSAEPHNGLLINVGNEDFATVDSYDFKMGDEVIITMKKGSDLSGVNYPMITAYASEGYIEVEKTGRNVEVVPVEVTPETYMDHLTMPVTIELTTTSAGSVPMTAGKTNWVFKTASDGKSYALKCGAFTSEEGNVILGAPYKECTAKVSGIAIGYANGGSRHLYPRNLDDIKNIAVKETEYDENDKTFLKIANSNFNTPNSEWNRVNFKDPGNSSVEWQTDGGIENSGCIKISLSGTKGSVGVKQALVGLKPNKMFRFRACVKTEGVSSGRGAVIFDVSYSQYWNSSKHMLGTNGWTEVFADFYSDANGKAEIACALGYRYSGTSSGGYASGTAWFDNVSVQEITEENYCYVESDHFILYTDTDKATKSNVETKSIFLDKAYEELIDLVGAVPYGGRKIVVTGTYGLESGYWALAGNPILLGYSSNAGVINNSKEITFGLIHEIGHDFNAGGQFSGAGFTNKWNWNDELFANFRAYYAVMKTNAPCSYGGTTYHGEELKNFYKAKYDTSFGAGKSTSSGDPFTYIFIRVGDTMGWDNFKQGWRDIYKDGTGPFSNNWLKFDYMITTLQKYTEVDIRASFPEGELDLIKKGLGGN